MLLKSTQNYLTKLFNQGAVKVDTVGGFKLALHDKHPTAPLSPFYISLRTPENKRGTLQPEDVDTIAHELVNAAAKKRITYDGVVGIPRAGTPLADAIVRHSHGKVAYIPLRKKSSTSRAMRIDPRRLSQPARAARRILIFDDLITKSDSKITAINVVKRAGYQVAGVAVYFDRMQGGYEHIAGMGIPIVRVVTITEMLDFYGEKKLISKTDLKKIHAYLGV